MRQKALDVETGSNTEPSPMAFLALKRKLTPQENLQRVRADEKEAPWPSSRAGETSNSPQDMFPEAL